ncbi:hypothetical protein Mgra_00007666, partial [Meloidogyne graminicola]
KNSFFFIVFFQEKFNSLTNDTKGSSSLMKATNLFIFVFIQIFQLTFEALPLIVSTWAYNDFQLAALKAFNTLISTPQNFNGSFRRLNALVEGYLLLLDYLISKLGLSECEKRQCDHTVGFGGSPDENGETTLDSLLIDGPEHKSGAVAALRNVKSAARVAWAVFNYTKHSLLVGEKATQFAQSMGFKLKSLSTSESIEMHKKWLNKKCQPNFWKNVFPEPEKSCGPYKPKWKPLTNLKNNGKTSLFSKENHDTIGMIIVDENRNVAAGTSSNGAKNKIPGRVGDSPIIGAGAYVDNKVGGAAATGDGDIMMKICTKEWKGMSNVSLSLLLAFILLLIHGQTSLGRNVPEFYDNSWSQLFQQGNLDNEETLSRVGNALSQLQNQHNEIPYEDAPQNDLNQAEQINELNDEVVQIYFYLLIIYLKESFVLQLPSNIGQTPGIALDPLNRLILFHRSERVWDEFSFDENNHLNSSDEKHFCKPTDVAVASTGEFFVADGYCNSRIMKFDKEGKFLSQFGQPDSSETPKNGEFLVPHSLTLIEDLNLLCVADRENERIQCFSAGLEGAKHQHRRAYVPTGIFFTKAENIGRVFAIREKEHFLVGVTNQNLGSQLEPSQVFIMDMNTGKAKSFAKGLVNAHSLAISENGDIYVSQIEPNQIIKFSISSNEN